MAGKPIFELIPEHSTQRTCSDSECCTPATQWRYTRNVEGGKNKSSRQPVCTVHGQFDLEDDLPF